MLKIVDGSIEKVKAEMKQMAKWKADEIKSVKAKIKSWDVAEKKAAKEEGRKMNTCPKEFDVQLEALQAAKERYSSAAVPVRVGNIVINFTVYQRAVSKLKDVFVYPEEILGYELIISYREGNPWEINLTGAKGQIRLYDISRLYTELNNIPVAEIERDVQAS